jgi:hypothetical protein
MAWGVRPSKYLMKWSVRDRALAEGLLEYERSLNQHGIPSWIAEDGTIPWETDEKIDYTVSQLAKVFLDQDGNPTKQDPGTFATLRQKPDPDDARR